MNQQNPMPTSPNYRHEQDSIHTAAVNIEVVTDQALLVTEDLRFVGTLLIFDRI